MTDSMLPKVRRDDGLLTRAVHVFPTTCRDITVTNTLDDPQMLEMFVTRNHHCRYGADGPAFNSHGNLIVGNFGDGALDQPGEPILWGSKLDVTCFDKVTGPDKVNSRHDQLFTIVFLDLHFPSK